MRRTINTAVAVLLFTLGCAHGQAEQPTPQRPALVPNQSSDVQLTGCIVQGSSPAIFLLANGKKDPKDAAEQAAKYFISPASPDVNLKAHLKHLVRITATPDLKVSAMPIGEPIPPSAERPGEERTLPRLIIKTVTMVSEKCS
jgi:hypothetical protein